MPVALCLFEDIGQFQSNYMVSGGVTGRENLITNIGDNTSCTTAIILYYSEPEPSRELPVSSLDEHSSSLNSTNPNRRAEGASGMW